MSVIIRVSSQGSQGSISDHPIQDIESRDPNTGLNLRSHYVKVYTRRNEKYMTQYSFSSELTMIFLKYAKVRYHLAIRRT